MSDCVLFGDKGYLSETIQLDLFQTVNIKLETPKRANQINYNHNLMFLENQEKELKPLFYKCVFLLLKRKFY